MLADHAARGPRSIPPSRLATYSAENFIDSTLEKRIANLNEQERLRLALERGRETLLVVEDEPGVRRLIEKILKQLGYTVLCAASADEAVDFLKGTIRPVDLILTDVVLPGMPVSRFIDYLRVHEPSVKLAFMTGHFEEAKFLPNLGADGTLLLRKPFTPAVLAKTIREILDSNQQRS